MARLNTGRFRLLTLAVGLSMVLDLSASPPAITHQPLNERVALNQQAVFAVIASGTSPLVYQWRRNGSAIAGATNDQLVLTNAQFSDQALYSVTVSNAESNVTSASATLSVYPPAAGDIDFSFASGGMITHPVWAVAVQADGKTLIGGEFTTTRHAVRSCIARLNVDGTSDHTFLRGLSGTDGPVYSIAVQSDGKILIGGLFYTVNGLPHARIARLHADGTIDNSFVNGLHGVSTFPPNAVRSIAIQSDGKIVVGGDFTTVTGLPRNRVARLNPDGTIDSSFMNGLSGITNGIVMSIALQDDGKVILGGDFTRVNGLARNRIARLHPDGAVDSDFLNGLSGANSKVWSIALQREGKIVLGGVFTNVNGTVRNRIARLNSDGSLDNSFMNGLAGANGDVNSMTTQNDGKLVIGGYFTTVNGLPRTRIARLNEDGTVDSAFLSSGSGANDWVLAIAPQSDGKLVVGGAFTAVNGLTRMRIARLNPDGTTEESFVNASSGVDGGYSGIFGMALQSDGKAIIAGPFTHVGGESRGYIARIQTNGTLDSDFRAELSYYPSYSLYPLVVQSNDQVLISGPFTTVNGISRSRIARLNADGTLDAGFLIGLSGPFAEVFCFGLQNDGKILIGGSFTNVNGQRRNRIARLSSDGTLDGGFQNGLSGANRSVSSIAVQSDGRILIGGSFTNVNGLRHNLIARLHPDGSIDSSFADGLSAITDGSVSSIAVQSDGKLLVAGYFGRVTSGTRLIARLNSDGTLDGNFPTLLFDRGSASSVAQQWDGKILVAGAFYTVNGLNRPAIVRLNTDGNVDTGFLKGLSGPNGPVWAVSLQPDGKVLIGGSFTAVNGIASAGISRLFSELQPPSIEGLSRPNGGNLTLSLRLAGGTTNRLQYNTDLNNPNWTDLPGDIVMGGSNGSTNKA